MMRVLVPTFRCNHRCHFCMLMDNVVQPGMDKPYEMLVAELDGLMPGDFVYVFGGEPTLYRDLIRLVQFIGSRQLFCSLATNGVRFSSRQFTEEVAAAGIGDIRTSIHGADAQTHDAATGVVGSFDKLCRGIVNIRGVGIPLSVNAVLTRDVLAQLNRMLDLLDSLRVQQIKMSMLVDVRYDSGVAPTLTEVRAKLELIIPEIEARGMEPIIEKAPLCVAASHVPRFVYEQGLLNYCLNTESKRAYGTEVTCGRCALRDACYGLDPGYLRYYGERELRPTERIDSSSVTVVDEYQLEKYSPLRYRTNLLSVTHRSRRSNEEVLGQLSRIASEARENIAGVFLVPVEAVAIGWAEGQRHTSAVGEGEA